MNSLSPVCTARLNCLVSTCRRLVLLFSHHLCKSVRNSLTTYNELTAVSSVAKKDLCAPEIQVIVQASSQGHELFRLPRLNPRQQQIPNASEIV